MGRAKKLAKRIARRAVRGKSNFAKYRDAYEKEFVNPNLIMLEASRGTAVNGNIFALLYDLETGEKWKDYEWFFVVTDKNIDEAASKFKFYGFTKVKLVKRDTPDYMRLLAKSKYLFTDNTYPTYYVKKPDQVLTCIWHGTPLKKLGRGNLPGADGLGNVQRNYFMSDYALFPNNHTRDVFLEDYMIGHNYSGKIVMSDYPRNQFLLNKARSDELKAELGLEGKKIFAYMPTWRGDGREVDNDKYIEEIDAYLKAVDAALTDDKLLYVNLHHFLDSALDYDDFKRIRPFPKEYETYDFLNICDSLITDYSSVFFDFSVSGKEVILFTYDYEHYMQTRGMYFDVADLPFRRCDTVEELIDAMNNPEKRDMAAYAEEFLKYTNEKAADVLLECVINGNEDSVEIEKVDMTKPRHFYCFSDFSSGFPEGVKEEILSRMELGEKVTLLVQNGLSEKTLPVLDRLTDTDYDIYYYTLTKLQGKDALWERQRLFPGIENVIVHNVNGSDRLMDIAGLLSRPFYPVIRVNNHHLKETGDEIEISFSLSTGKDFDLIHFDEDGENVYPLTQSSGTLSVRIPKKDLIDFNPNSKVLLHERSEDALYYVKCKSDLTKKKNMFFTEYVMTDEGSITCYFLENKSNLVFTVRPSNYTDSAKEMKKIRRAFASSYVGRGKKNDIVLFEKNSERYEESASVLFEKLIDEGYDNVYFILDKSTDYYENIPEKYRSHVVPKFSYKHYKLIFTAASFLGTENITHVLEKRTLSVYFRYWRNKMHYNYVFLQHGVMYMLSLDSESRGYFRQIHRNGLHRIVVSSELEKKHFTDQGMFPPEILYVSGLPKFDRAEREEGADRIVIMPTWRPWEENLAATDFTATSYYGMLKRMYYAVPEELREKTIVLPHPLIRHYIEEDDAELSDHVLETDNYDEVLKKTDLLITDYSSISYDAFYRGSGVIFYWEEKDECMEQYGERSRIMLTEDLAFGDVCYNSESLAESVRGTYGKERPKKYLDNYAKVVEFHDNKNTERLIEMMKRDGIL